ncbi:MAG: elongation factor G [Spirochaetales bacterium]
MGVSTDRIRNVAVAGHGFTGKTTLFEQLLFTAGKIDDPQTVASGRTVSDYSDEERQHGSSMHTVLASMEWNGSKINLLDTPGTSDFIGEVVAAFRACESALMVVDGREGVQIETIKLWRRLDNRNKPRSVFISYMDDAKADFSAALEDLQTKFEKPLVPVVVPVGSGDSFKGVVDLVNNRFYQAPGHDKRESGAEVPEDVQRIVEQYRPLMIESAAEGDDELTEKYLTEETLSDEEVRRGLMEGLRDNRVVPVLCGAATSGSGTAALLDFLVNEAPNPAEAQEHAIDEEGNEESVTVSAEGDFSGFSFKTMIDQFSGKLSFFKVVTGRLAADSDLWNPREGKKEKTSKVFTALGKKLEEVDELPAGDIGILTKLQTVHTNDTLCAHNCRYTYKPLALPQPVYSVAIAAGSKKDEDKLSAALQRITEEDKTIQLTLDPETGESVLSGMGEMHINLILERIRENQKIEVQTSIPKVAYRETITKPADAVYRHKKQSGGHGQFGEVSIQIKPLERGREYEFENAIRGMAVSKGFVPGIEKGLKEAMSEGIIAGFPAVDIGTTLVDGKEHPVDSSEMAFKMAAKGAMRDAMQKAKPVLLEPVMDLLVFIDEQYLGDVLSDLSSRRGRVQGQENLGGGIIEVIAQVPQAELLRYATDLRSITSGTGSFEMTFSHYSPVSGKVADDIVKQAQEESASA